MGVLVAVTIGVPVAAPVDVAVTLPAETVPVGRGEPDGAGVALPRAVGGVALAVPGATVAPGNEADVGVAEGVGVGGRETMAMEASSSAEADCVICNQAASVAASAIIFGSRGANRALSPGSSP